MTLQEFILEYKDKGWYLTAMDNTPTLEVNCKQRQCHITDKEIEILKELDYVNVLSEADYTKLCCGYATFMKREDLVKFNQS